jgi:hypothetical protein
MRAPVATPILDSDDIFCDRGPELVDRVFRDPADWSRTLERLDELIRLAHFHPDIGDHLEESGQWRRVLKQLGVPTSAAGQKLLKLLEFEASGKDGDAVAVVHSCLRASVKMEESEAAAWRRAVPGGTLLERLRLTERYLQEMATHKFLFALAAAEISGGLLESAEESEDAGVRDALDTLMTSGARALAEAAGLLGKRRKPDTTLLRRLLLLCCSFVDEEFTVNGTATTVLKLATAMKPRTEEEARVKLALTAKPLFEDG